jgi:hypothetical protein
MTTPFSLFDYFVLNHIRPPWFMWTVKDQSALYRRWLSAKDIGRERWIGATSDGSFLCTAQSGANVGRTHYAVSLGGCTCPDAPKAPWAWCKHRIALWVWHNSYREGAPTTKEEVDELNKSLFG